MSDCQELEARPSKECQTTAFKAGLLGPVREGGEDVVQSDIATGTLELGGMQTVCLLAKKQPEVGGNLPLGAPPLVAMQALNKNIITHTHTYCNRMHVGVSHF